MARQYICQSCRQKDIDENMITVEVGKQKKRYHKLNCYDEYVKDLEFKKKEKAELDELVEVIKRVHEIETIPNQFYSYLQDIRNGNELFGKLGQKRQKQGYEYKIITATYEDCTESINWARNNKDFKGILAMLKYTLAIIRDKIDFVNERVKREEHKREVEKVTEEQALNTFEHINRQPVEYKKKKSKNDTSAFLN